MLFLQYFTHHIKKNSTFNESDEYCLYASFVTGESHSVPPSHFQKEKKPKNNNISNKYLYLFKIFSHQGFSSIKSILHNVCDN